MACGPKDIYTALTSAGFSTAQAIGVMANGLAESGLSAEARVIDSNGYYSDGIWQFNEKSYPNAHSLVTGNCSADIRSQVVFLKSVVSGQALNGSTPAQVAGNFAQFFERCQTCQPGGTSYGQRVANAGIVAGWVRSGKWPTSAAGLATGSASSSGGSSSSSSTTGNTCLIKFPGIKVPVVGSVGSGCILSKSQARALLGGMLLVAGGAVFLVGAIVMAAGAFQRAAPALAGAADAAAVLPGGGAAAEGLTRAHRRASQSGAQVASQRRGARVTAQRQAARQQRTAEVAAQREQRRSEAEQRRIQNPRRPRALPARRETRAPETGTSPAEVHH